MVNQLKVDCPLKIDAILLSGGSGVRFTNSIQSLLSKKQKQFFNLPKTFISLKKKQYYPIYKISVDLIKPYANKLVLVVPKNQVAGLKKNQDNIAIIQGGTSRFDSVFNALQFIKNNTPTQEKNHYVLVHDCARALLHSFDLAKIIKQVDEFKNNSDLSGAIMASYMSDSVKQKIESKNAKSNFKNIDRDNLFIAQTPQIFRFLDLWNAYNQTQNIKNKITDEACAIEKIGLSFDICTSEFENFKINTLKDYLLVKKILKMRKNELKFQ